MLEWLKEILGESYTEEIDKRVSVEIGKGFVAKADFDAKNTELKTVKGQLSEANKAIEEFKSLDIDGVRRAAAEWQKKAEQAERDAAQRIADMEFDGVLRDAISAAKGRNAKAITALLDVSALKQSKNQAEDIKTALANLREGNSYLFEEDKTPPPYAPGAGTQNMGGNATGVEAAFAALNPGLNLN